MIFYSFIVLALWLSSLSSVKAMDRCFEMAARPSVSCEAELLLSIFQGKGRPESQPHFPQFFEKYALLSELKRFDFSPLSHEYASRVLQEPVVMEAITFAQEQGIIRQDRIRQLCMSAKAENNQDALRFFAARGVNVESIRVSSQDYMVYHPVRKMGNGYVTATEATSLMGFQDRFAHGNLNYGQDSLEEAQMRAALALSRESSQSVLSMHSSPMQIWKNMRSKRHACLKSILMWLQSALFADSEEQRIYYAFPHDLLQTMIKKFLYTALDWQTFLNALPAHSIKFIMSLDTKQGWMQFLGSLTQHMQQNLMENPDLRAWHDFLAKFSHAEYADLFGIPERIRDLPVAELLKAGEYTTCMRVMFRQFEKYPELLAYLLWQGADINAQSDGQTILMQAAQEGNAKAVEILLENGADVNKKDRQGQTALIKVAQTGNVQMAGLLLLWNADPVIRDIDLMCARDYASQEKHTDLAIFLKEAEMSYILNRR